MYTLYGTSGTGSSIIEIAHNRCGVPWRQSDACYWKGSEALQKTGPEFVRLLMQIDADLLVAPVFARHWPQWREQR